MWLAQVGRERIEETIDPELSIDRALETYVKLGYDADWINQRLQTIRARKELTDQWKSHGVEQGKEFAILTDDGMIVEYLGDAKIVPEKYADYLRSLIK